VADIGRSYGVGQQQSFGFSSEASGGHLRGCEATSALTTGGSGGCLWLAARIAQATPKLNQRDRYLAASGGTCCAKENGASAPTTGRMCRCLWLPEKILTKSAKRMEATVSWIRFRWNGASGGTLARWLERVASTRCHRLLTPSAPVGSLRLAQHNPIQSVSWH
jgi:hypothetical protein